MHVPTPRYEGRKIARATTTTAAAADNQHQELACAALAKARAQYATMAIVVTEMTPSSRARTLSTLTFEKKGTFLRHQRQHQHQALSYAW